MRRGTAGPALRALAALALLAPAVAGCEDSGAEEPRGRAPRAGELAWKETPRVFTPETLLNDRILTGEVRNEAIEPLEIAASDVRLTDAGGDRVPASVVFLRAFSRGLYPPTREPEELPRSELRRTGRIAVVQPGEATPLTAAWRRPRIGEGPVRIDYGGGSLPLPR